MIDFEQLEADLKAGTQGPMTYRIASFSGDCGITAPNFSVVIECMAWSEAVVNANRVCRLDDLEAYALFTRKKLEVAEALVNHIKDVEREYETEYAGRTYEICSGCGAQISEGQSHYSDCAWSAIDAALAEWNATQEAGE